MIQPSKKTFCTAPFTSFVIDPDKGVRPCCTFAGHQGNIGQDQLTDILSGDQWQSIQRQVSEGKMPDGCANCYSREKATGWSVRTSSFDPRLTRKDNWEKGLTQIEINSSNVCNLACTHCSSTFSSRWGDITAKLDEENIPHYRNSEHSVYKPDPDNMVRQLAALDLSYLKIARFKGGEPLLNPDFPAVLRHLSDRGILNKIKVMVVTNGSIVKEEILALVRQAGAVHFIISVDGTGKLQEYIRHGPSELLRIERFLENFSTLEHVTFSLSVSVMVYNVFTLDRITNWWYGLRTRYHEKLRYPLSFGLHVVDPPILSVNVLQDSTRKKLVKKYRRLRDADYTHVIQALKQPFAGAAVHDEFVAYTRGMDKIRGTAILDVVPELETEMVLLKTEQQERKWRLFDFRHKTGTAAETLGRGIALSRTGRYKRALKLYDRFLIENQGKGLAAKWEVELHRAVILGMTNEWRKSLYEFYRLVQADPKMTLSAAQRPEALPPGKFLGAISRRLAGETGFVETPSFRLVIEGLAYQALGIKHEAVARVAEALQLDPKFDLAKIAREEMNLVA